MLEREKILDLIKKLPEQVLLEEVLDSIMLLDKIEKGLQESLEGKTTSDDQLIRKFPKWLR